MTEILNLNNVNKIITNRFPTINNNFILETSIEDSYYDKFFPINSYKSDNFIEFRIPKSVGIFTDLSELNLKFTINFFKRDTDVNRWSDVKKLTTGDHVDLVNISSYTIFKHCSLKLNQLQCENIDNYALNSYIKTITNFNRLDIETYGHFLHVENYEKIIETLEDDTYFTNLDANSRIAQRLFRLRDKGITIRAPLLFDIVKTNKFLIDGVDLSINLALHDLPFIFFTNQYASVPTSTKKQFGFTLSDISLEVKRLKPSINAYNALIKALLPKSPNNIPNIDYPFISQLSKTYHIPSNITQFVIDLPFQSKIPDKIFICFQTHSAFNTRSYNKNGLYLSHLNLKNTFITINSKTIYNINSDFENLDVLDLYNCTLKCLPSSHLITFNNFCQGMTLLGFPLTYTDETANINAPLHGVLRIVFSFKTELSEAAIIYMLGDVLSVLSINMNREVFLNRA